MPAVHDDDAVEDPEQRKSPTPALPGILGMTRFTIILAIFGIGLSSAVLLVYSTITLVKFVIHAFRERAFDLPGVQHLALELIEMTDFFLLGMVLYVVAIGMYELFIDPDVNVPEWMKVHSLDELKSQIVNVVIVMLVVIFLGIALSTKQGGRDFLFYALAISSVVLAVSVFNWVHNQKDGGKH